MVTISYCNVWKWIDIDGSVFYNFYGKNFNPNVPSFPSWWNTCECYDETSTFSLFWFQPWHEVGCSVVNFTNIDDLSWAYLFFYFYQWNQTSYPSWVNNFWYQSFGSYNTYAYYAYFWIDNDEIWNGYSTYRYTWVLTTSSSDSSSSARLATYTGSFSVSGLSIDSTKHDAWYFRVGWSWLCYIDWTSNTKWYKHMIAEDSWYSWWSWEPWYVWIPNSSTDYHIYYTDRYGTVRRTQESDRRYWYANSWYYPSWAQKWKIYVSNSDFYHWYWYLCYVTNWWEVRRMWNWTP